ncbi:hypothetical protein O3P69_003214 [Scylla paramamosain]|uniref:Uncharacterized protein n=1 Tax=Scylla paramamosain TaxID=85552 RepID=A0AAW0UL27_SCYPA
MFFLCLLDYEFHILDNAFVVHRPGIKKQISSPMRDILVEKQTAMIEKIIPEYKAIFGRRTPDVAVTVAWAVQEACGGEHTRRGVTVLPAFPVFGPGFLISRLR